MMDNEFLENIFNRVYDGIIENLEYKYQKLGTPLKDIENELDHLYIYQGHCWDGRSETKDIEIEATVQAYQVFLHKHKQNTKKI